MPSLSIAAALLILGNSEGLPWTSPTWQNMTHVIGVPWHTEPGVDADAQAPHVHTWTTRIAEGIKTYARNLWSASDLKEQIRYSNHNLSDNDRAGRTAWNKWVQENWGKRWKMNDCVDKVFTEHKCSPYDLPRLEDSQVPNVVTTPLAHALFGESAYEDDVNFLVPEIKCFVDALIVQTWNRYRKGISREARQLQKDQGILEEEWKAITQEGTTPSIKMIKSYLTRLRRVFTILVRYQDKKTTDDLEAKQKMLEAMLGSALNNDADKDIIDKLPKVLREALGKLASEQDVRDIERLVRTALENLGSNNAEIQVEFPEGRPINLFWKEGTEDLSELSEDQVWSYLGFQDTHALPFFQKYTDPDGIIDPWSEEGERWLASETNPREPLSPRWHQLVGIYRMLERAFEGEPVLLMDGVGIGKTLQVIGVIACFAFYHHFFDKNGTFPGAFANKKWQGQVGNIPDRPFIIICPVNIHPQWSREIERFLTRGSFDLFPYTGKPRTRKTWWVDIFPKSHHSPSHRIILATEKALQEDASTIFSGIILNVEGEPQRSWSYDSNVSSTVYNQDYLAMIMDEAHAVRKFNKLHTAAYALRSCSSFMVAMTATPVMTKLQDLWIMGHFMGIGPFFNKSQYDEVQRELVRAQAKDRRTERQSDEAGNHLRAQLAGEGSRDLTKTEYHPCIQKHVPFVRDTFSKHVIRRTLDSIDYQGHKIFGLKPYCEHIMLLELREWEKKALSSLTDHMIESKPATTLISSTSNFYIDFRRGLLHPHMSPRSPTHSWRKPCSIDEWQNMASTKLDVLAKILHHHLQQDNAKPLRVCDDGQTLEIDDSAVAEEVHQAECDRVVIFSVFPSSNATIRDVLSLYDIKTVELNGKTPHSKRKSVLNEFRTSTRDAGARVLILSMVGAVGLNLACANIMVVADTLWSALDDEQLRGRIYRFPQQKQVHFYRLVARGTLDVFLNNLAFDKGMLHLAFVGMDDKTLSLFNGDDSTFDPARASETAPEDPEDLEYPPQNPPQPLQRAEIRAINSKRPPSPVRPSTKRSAPTSPASAEHVPVNPKKLKQITAASNSTSMQGKGDEGSSSALSTSAHHSATFQNQDDDLKMLDGIQDIIPGAFTSTAVPEMEREPEEVSNPAIPSSPIASLTPTMPPDWNVDLETDNQTQLMVELFGDCSDEGGTLSEICTLDLSSGVNSSSWPHSSECSSITDLPPSLSSSPTPSHQGQTFTTGIKPRHPAHPTPTTEGPSNSSQPPTVEHIGGMPLIPGSMRRFKGSGRQSHGKGKRKE